MIDKRVAHRPIACLGQQCQRGILGHHLLLRSNHPQLCQNVVELHRVKAEVLAARTNRLRNIFRLRRRHHEDHMRRRLFQCLQQRIEGRFRDLVRFVENVDLVPVARRRIACRIAQFANLVDAAIGGRVNLDHVDRVALANLHARIAYAAGLRRRPLRAPNLRAAIQSLRQDARDRRLPMPRCPEKMYPCAIRFWRQGIQQRARHMVLAGHVGKTLRTILPGQNLVTHAESAPRAAPISRAAQVRLYRSRLGGIGEEKLPRIQIDRCRIGSLIRVAFSELRWAERG